jgi:hypothetical protein
MLPAQFTDDEHGCSRLINEVPALFDLCLYAPLEFLF